MGREKAAGIGLVLADAILILFCIARYAQLDRTAPRFLLEGTEIIYSPGMDSNELKRGITANDNRDGDVTDRIVIEKITENYGEGTAVVYYAVCDAAGNAAKMSKLFSAEYPEGQEGEGKGKQDGMSEKIQGQPDAGGQSGQGQASLEDMGGDAEGQEGEGADSRDGDADDVEGHEDDEPGEDERNGEPEEGISGDEEPEGGIGGDGGAQEAGPDPETGQTDMPETAGGAPELALKSDEVAINAGTNPPWTEIITTLRDDKDDYAALYYNLHVGQYDRDRPGSYPVTVYVEDSDGNRSQEIPFTIIVR